MLMRGGNAADAAVATAAALNVTEPSSTGIGGDCFALFYDGKTREITALNASGRAPMALSLDLIAKQGLGRSGQLPPRHAHTVTVPGACSGWCEMIARHGTMPLAEVLAPAIRLAEEGYPVSPITAHAWSHGDELHSNPGGQELLIDGRAPRAGELFRNPTLGRTFRAVADGGADAFYRGEIAGCVAETVQTAGGVMAIEDLAAHRATWETPISVDYHGARVWECPPNGQGLAALIALNILVDLPRHPPLSPERLHLQIEAMRLGFADAGRYIADPAHSPVPVKGLLSEEYAGERRRLIQPDRAMAPPSFGLPAAGSDTVYFCVVDGQGNACSFINSNYMGFGTGLVPPGCGFTLQNRGANFRLDPGHPNALAPGKRPYHTIIPGLLTRPDGSLLGPFGVMGGFMQPQGHMQVVAHLVDDGLDPQTTLDQPRFCVGGDVVYLEEGLPAEALARLGHPVQMVTGYDRALFGRGQIILREPDGVLWAGSDMRADGCAMGW
jgi:gamma-glutamyltranspeptidase/glutathione hydrolase